MLFWKTWPSGKTPKMYQDTENVSHYNLPASRTRSPASGRCETVTSIIKEQHPQRDSKLILLWKFVEPSQLTHRKCLLQGLPYHSRDNLSDHVCLHTGIHMFGMNTGCKGAAWKKKDNFWRPGLIRLLLKVSKVSSKNIRNNKSPCMLQMRQASSTINVAVC